jgi:glycosyltransferase involved in cell wall biosynthesis
MDDKKDKNATISVIISSFSGNEALTQKCIDSLEGQGRKPDEIIVVVDTEKERSGFERAIRPHSVPLQIFASGKQGLVAARNKGIDESNGDIIAFIDDDAEADSAWVSQILGSLSSQGDAVLVGGRAIPRFQGNPIPQSLYWIVGCTSEDPPTRRPIGCNMAFRREVFDKFGKFDENLVKERKGMGISEETEFILRITETLPGSSIFFDPGIVVYHHVPEKRTKMKYIMKRAFAEGGAKAYTIKKYGREVEKSYLKYYLSHPDLPTFMVLFSIGLGYVKGMVFNR